MSARLLAAAADGHRNGQEIFFVARFEPVGEGDYEVEGPYSRGQLGHIRVPEGFGAVRGVVRGAKGAGDHHC